MLKNIMEVPEVLAGAILNVNKLLHGTSICSAPIPLTTIPFSSGNIETVRYKTYSTQT
jgi:hypothetical protein